MMLFGISEHIWTYSYETLVIPLIYVMVTPKNVGVIPPTTARRAEQDKMRGKDQGPEEVPGHTGVRAYGLIPHVSITLTPARRELQPPPDLRASPDCVCRQTSV